MARDIIQIPRVNLEKKIEKIERAAREAGCNKFEIVQDGRVTNIIVPREKTPTVYQNLLKKGLIPK